MASGVTRIMSPDHDVSSLESSIQRYVADVTAAPSYRTVAVNYTKLREATRSGNVHITVPSGTTIVIPESFELEATSTLKVEQGAKVRIEGRAIIKGVVDAGSYPIFEGGGTILWKAKHVPLNQRWLGLTDTDIQKAQTALAGGGQWFFPSGIYTVRTSISPAYGTFIRGEGPYKSTLVSYVSGGPCISVSTLGDVDSDHQDCEIRDLQVVSDTIYAAANDDLYWTINQRTDGTAATSDGGIKVFANFCTVRNCRVVGFHSGALPFDETTPGGWGDAATEVKYGINQSGSVSGSIIGCSSFANDIGIYVDNGSESDGTGPMVHNCTVQFNRTHGIKALQCTGGSISQCRISHNGGQSAVLVEDCDGFGIMNCRFEANGSGKAPVDDSGTTNLWMKSADIQIKGNNDAGAPYSATLVGNTIRPGTWDFDGPPAPFGAGMTRYALRLNGYLTRVTSLGNKYNVGAYSVIPATRYSVFIEDNTNTNLTTFINDELYTGPPNGTGDNTQFINVGSSTTPAPVTFPDGATPTISTGVDRLWYFGNANNTNITNILGGRRHDRITIISQHTGVDSTQFNSGSGGAGQLRLSLGANFVMTALDSITLGYDDTGDQWIEIARSINA